MDKTNIEEKEAKELRHKLSDTLDGIGLDMYCTTTKAVIIRTDSYGDSWEEDIELSELTTSLRQAVMITEQLIKEQLGKQEH